MFSSIQTQYLTTSNQSAVNKNKTGAGSGASFSEAFSQAADSLEKTSRSNISVSSEESESIQTDMLNVIQDKMREIQTKLENGETDPTFQIGGRSFTDKQWKELIHKIDKFQEQNKKKIENESEKKNANEINQNDKGKTVKRIDDTESDNLIALLLSKE